MGKIKASSINKGLFILDKNNPCLVVEREFVNPGKGSAFIKLKIKNIKNGAALKVTYKSNDSIEEIDVEDVEAQYLYSTDESYFFMEMQTFEQLEIPRKGLEDAQYFMMDGETYHLVRWEKDVLDIKFPPKIDLVVTEAEDGVKGDTVTGATKWITLETGLSVKVPIFIKKGEKIRINVETKEYQERVND